jgi:hypothetical protein
VDLSRLSADRFVPRALPAGAALDLRGRRLYIGSQELVEAEGWEVEAFHVGQKEFVDWFGNPEGDFVMANLPPHIKELLRAKSDALVFSYETLVKQKSNHPEIAAEDYVSVLNGIPGCGEIYRTRDYHVGLVVKDRQAWAVILKTTKDYAESYMVSLHRLNKDTLVALRKMSRAY